jgi:methionyl-tRNA formyltransferase
MSDQPIRTVFMGTAGIAVPSLKALHADPRTEVLAVVSQPDRPKGRKLQLLPTDIHAAADSLGLPVLQPARCREPGFLEELRRLRPDVIAVMAYGQILPPALLDLPRHGCLNVHTSLLPRHRGAAPIQWAIWDGDAETGVTIMRMDAGMDTGDILATARTPIQKDDDAASIHDRLAELGADLLADTLPRHIAGEISPQAQDHALATHARKISKEDGRLDWQRSATALWHQVRALTPWPGTWCHWHHAGRPSLLKVWKAAPVDAPNVIPGQVMKADREGLDIVCGEGALRLLEVQKEGGRRMSSPEFLAGNPLGVGDRLD